MLLLAWPGVSFSATNTATDGGGTTSVAASGTVTVNSIGNAVTSAVSEISPNSVIVSSSGNTLTYDILPLINAGDTGLDQVAITAPAGYSSLSVTSVTTDATARNPGAGCPVVNSGEYCVSIAGQTMTVSLGDPVVQATTNKEIRIVFTADAPGVVGSADFTATVDDSSTALVPAQSTSAGNADGDAGDSNSITVAVITGFGSCPVVTTTADSGPSSLRECINYANANPGTTISFNIASAPNQSVGVDSWWRITPGSALPSITADNTMIDGTTQTTNQGDTNSQGPEIEIDGAGGAFNGLTINSANNTIKGLIIGGFGGVISWGIFIDGAPASTNTISGNYIGTDYSGSAPNGNSYGVGIGFGAQFNTIGGTTAGERNIISGNTNFGVRILSNSNTVIGNYIGTDKNGTAALSNGTSGITISTGGQSNTIGGTTVDEKNIISGNGIYGVGITGNATNGNTVTGNFIGTDVNGTAALANGLTGVFIMNGAQSNTIGGTTVGERNVLSGNASYGLIINGNLTNNNRVIGNFIGTDMNGSAALANVDHGIYIWLGAQANMVGGTASGEVNTIAFNGGDGIYVAGAGTVGNEISANSIFENSGLGIDLDGAGANNNIPSPTITSITANGVNFDAIATLQNNDTIEFFRVNNGAAPVVTPDGSGSGEGFLYLGTCLDNGACSGPNMGSVADSDGNLGTIQATLLSNGGAGFNGGDTLTATATDGANNTSEFSANLIVDSCPVVTTIADSGPGSLRECINYANANPGTTISFNIASAPNQSNGADSWWRITPASTLPSIITANTVIAGSTQTANQGDTNTRGPEIEIDGSSTGNGLLIDNVDHVTIRDLVINRSAAAGIRISGAGATQNKVYGNYLGTDAVGEAAAGNAYGVYLDVGASDNDIGGINAGEGNICSSGTWGLFLVNTSSTRIRGNKIGTDRTGTARLSNAGGIILFGTNTDTLIGGPEAGAGNIISGSINYGIWANGVTTGTVIYGNTVGTGVTGNEATLGNNMIGIYLPDAATTIIGGTGSGQGNRIAYNGNHGIELGGTGTNHEITGNTIHNNAGDGLRVTAADSLITQNVIWNNGSSGQNGILLNAGATNSMVYHNTLNGNDGNGISLQATGVTIQNNIISNHGSGSGIDCTELPALHTNNDYFSNGSTTNGCGGDGSGSITSDPQFIDEVGGDFRLTECTSPAVEAGIDLGGAQPDMNGTTAGLYNGTAPDMGALESSCTSAQAVTSAIAEIDPNEISMGSPGNIFTYDILPTINPGDTGFDVAEITTPAGYTSLSAISASVGGTVQSLNCPAPGAGEYCASISGQIITITLGTKITASLTNLQIRFQADVPAVPGIADFTAIVDDGSTTLVSPQAITAGNADGDSTDQNSITVQVEGNAVSSVVAEISPNSAGAGSTGNNFTYDLLPTINPGDTGFDQIAITAPAGYTSLAVTSLSIGGSAQSLNCPSPAASEYCASITGQIITIALGFNFTTSGTPIQIGFSADAPNSTGTADFTAMVDDTVTGSVSSQSASPGDADGDPTDNNSMTVQVIGNAVSSIISEISPNSVAVDSLSNPFIYDILPTINPGDTGIDQIEITAPTGYTNYIVNNVMIGGAALTASCPVPGANEYCTTVTGQDMAIALGTKITTSGTHFQIFFDADAPSTTGSADFISTLDDRSTPLVPPQPNAPGDADGDPLDANSLTVQVLLTVPGVTQSTVTADPIIVIADGISTSTITTALFDAASTPITGKNILLSSDRPGMDIMTQPLAATDTSGIAIGTIQSNEVGIATITAVDTTDNIILGMQPQVIFTQGLVLELTKRANKKEAVIGDIVTYTIEIKNTTTNDVVQVKIDDQIPPNFKYMKQSARLNGQPMAEPAGNRTLTFDIGTIPALVDSNANGKADPGEPGYAALRYSLIIGSGATPGDYLNTVVAKDICDQCRISNTDQARVEVTLDPLFDLGTIIGKVFEDKDQDGWQDKGEAGVAGAMVVLDNGTYALTDEHGRYHFPAVMPGHRLVKINVQSLPAGATATVDQARIISVTPGLLAKANFGVDYEQDTQIIGRPSEIGLLMLSQEDQKPIQVVGSAKSLTVLINGKKAELPSGHVTLMVEGLDEVIEFSGNKLDQPLEFYIEAKDGNNVERWDLNIMNGKGEVIRNLSGQGNPPEVLHWNGETELGRLIQGGEIYQYQIEMVYSNGTIAKSARRIFGVNQTSAISLNLTGGAFETGLSELSDAAMNILRETANLLRRFPEEKVIIEGHTDAVGTVQNNLELSKSRAEAALSFLVQTEKIPEERFIIRHYGESRPIASNKMPESRELNRRVEVKGEVKEIDKAKLVDQYRRKPGVRINSTSIDLDRHARFMTQVEGDNIHDLNVEVTDAQGKMVQATLPVPSLNINKPKGEILLAYGERGQDYSVSNPHKIGEWNKNSTAALHKLEGRTEPENTVELDGHPLTVHDDGTFQADLKLKIGHNRYGLLVQNPQGFTRIADLKVDVNDRDNQGEFIVAVEPIPYLAVNLPPKGTPLRSPLLVISGRTDTDNRIYVNGVEAEVQPDGAFTFSLTLPQGRSRITVEVLDPDGYKGTIERDVNVTQDYLFFLAFADGKIGQLKAKGYIEGAGQDKSKKTYTEGRVVYYLKGMIAGKYLITSAFDTGTKELDEMFKDLDEDEMDRFFTNLDPDKYYPVYGDNSTIVYDAESQGKFYLALDSDELHLLIGNYAAILTDTELATYQRTQYGAYLSYTSSEQTQYARPETEAVLFAAQVRQEHVHDELRATGGSLYYLSHKDLIEGSEQVTIVIRDKNTGLMLSRLPQQQNLDYTIKYEEGRILFQRPISSVVQDDTLIDQELLSGSFVYVYVDYESKVEAFDKTAVGGRVRQQIGDHLSVGGTYVKDELNLGQYELTGMDTEIRLGQNTFFVGELAKTSGTDSISFVSDDGGLSYMEMTPSGTQEGKAWKAAAEIDIGEWFKQPNLFRVGGYFKKLEDGFLSSGNALERGTKKRGINLSLKLTDRDMIVSRYDRTDTEPTNTAVATRTHIGTLQWDHDRGWWGLTTEFQKRDHEEDGSENSERTSTGAARIRANPTDDLNVYLEHQNTFSGTRNNQTTLGTEYQVQSGLALQASGTTGTSGQSAQGGMVLTIDEKRLYLTERVDQSKAGRSTSTVLGAETPLDPSSKIYTEYQWEHTADQDRSLSLTGIQKRWKAAPGITLELAGEYSDIDSGPEQTSRYTVATGLSYEHPSGIKISTRNELREETGQSELRQYLTVNGLEIKLTPDFTFMGKYRFSETQDKDLDEIQAKFTELNVGLAYRPIAHDRFNALARYSQLTDQRPINLAETESSRTTMDVFSLESSLDIHPSVEWVEKVAYRIQKEKTVDGLSQTTRTYLSINRLNFQMWRRFYLGMEYRILFQKEADDKRQGWLMELMWEATKNLRLGIGYNFTDFSDNEFSDNDYSVQGGFFRIQGKY